MAGSGVIRHLCSRHIAHSRSPNSLPAQFRRRPVTSSTSLMLAPLFICFAPDMTRKELTDLVGEKVG
jgi:hypothetical protein